MKPPGEKEMQLRALRNQRVQQNKQLIDATIKQRARIIGKIGNVKISDVKVGAKVVKRGNRRGR